ncbi:dTDP-4-dehydrorhamnose 3,5-epimerase family protein [Sphaerisporangium dianthi]|uniref:dTDP-4-dehydrorhamnose 3,5-epimerase family protein n=1 Tax=Sphaerisporangium dianthi TaxID=1436120 RepID=A0ABV9CQ51_9ACTN
MRARKLSVEGAVEFTPEVFPDERGLFASPYQEPAFVEAVGRPLFPVAQTSHSRSRRGVVRGVHYTATPPGNAKYVYCPQGRALDLIVDLRTGSPTFGAWDAVELTPGSYRSVYLPIGVGHAFVILEDDTIMSYLLSMFYDPAVELAISPLDPALGLPIPAGLDPLLSPRDREAPTLAAAMEAGTLPEYDVCQRMEAARA